MHSFTGNARCVRQLLESSAKPPCQPTLSRRKNRTSMAGTQRLTFPPTIPLPCVCVLPSFFGRPLLVGLALAPGIRVLHGLTFFVLQLIAVKAITNNILSELCESARLQWSLIRVACWSLESDAHLGVSHSYSFAKNRPPLNLLLVFATRILPHPAFFPARPCSPCIQCHNLFVRVLDVIAGGNSLNVAFPRVGRSSVKHIPQ